jgi:hypothetical protein
MDKFISNFHYEFFEVGPQIQLSQRNFFFILLIIPLENRLEMAYIPLVENTYFYVLLSRKKTRIVSDGTYRPVPHRRTTNP